MVNPMKTTDKILIGIAAILVVIALAIVLTKPEVPPSDGENNSLARELFIKAVDIGKGQDRYFYSYIEKENDFTSTYSLLKTQDGRMVGVEGILSKKQIYFLEEDTILCIEYNKWDNVCSSVENESALDNYLDSIDLLFFNDQRMEGTKTNMEYFERYGYIVFLPETAEKEIDGNTCTEIRYRFDFNNMSVYEASRFGIGAYTPKEFEWTMCVGRENGEIYSKSVEYTQNGVTYRNEFKLVKSEWGTERTLVVPGNLSTGAVDLLIEEKTQQTNLLNCYNENDEQEKNKCIAVIALNLKNRDICELSGSRRDRCLVSIVPLTKNETICADMVDEEFKNDCYIEMTGATGDRGYCARITNETKKEFCLNLEILDTSGQSDLPADEDGTVPEDQDVDDFIREIYETEVLHKNQTNETGQG